MLVIDSLNSLAIFSKEKTVQLMCPIERFLLANSVTHQLLTSYIIYIFRETFVN